MSHGTYPPEVLESIESFALDGILPQDADYFSKENAAETKCCFCQRSTGSDPNNYKVIDIPQGMYTRIVTFCRICSICQDKIEDRQHSAGVRSPKEYTFDTCIGCGKNYPITEEEFSARNIDKTYGYGHCNSCIVNINPDIANKARICTTTCANKECTNTLITDYVFTPKGEIRCEDCSIVRRLESRHIMIDHEVYFRYESGENHHCTIFWRKQGKLDKELVAVKGNNKSNVIYEAVYTYFDVFQGNLDRIFKDEV